MVKTASRVRIEQLWEEYQHLADPDEAMEARHNLEGGDPDVAFEVVLDITHRAGIALPSTDLQMFRDLYVQSDDPLSERFDRLLSRAEALAA